MNNIAIIISESTYQNNSIQNLDMCNADAKRIRKILESSGKYNSIIELIDRTRTSIYDELSGLKSENDVNELLIYYSGHGYQQDGEFYFITADTNPEMLNSTTIKNSDVDDIIRNLNPNLYVKIIDACHSGSQYIKSIDISEEIKKTLSDAKKGFANCYFMFSSSFDQISAADALSSRFTRYLIKAIDSSLKKSESIKYRDVADEITDFFKNDNMQKPYFVTQGFNNEVFLNKNSDLIETVSQILREIDNVPIRINSDNNNATKTLCSKEQAILCRNKVFATIERELIDKINILNEHKYISVHNTILPSNVILKSKIGEWINANVTTRMLFAEPIETPVWNNTFHMYQPPDYYEITSFKLNVDTDNSIIEIEFKCDDYPLPKYNFQIVALFSINYLYLIYGIGKALPKNWDEYVKFESITNICIKQINMAKDNELNLVTNEIISDVKNQIEKDLSNSLNAYK